MDLILKDIAVVFDNVDSLDNNNNNMNGTQRLSLLIFLNRSPLLNQSLYKMNEQILILINHVVSFLILGAFTIYNSKIKFLKGVCHVKKTLQYCWPHTLHKVIRSASHVEFICASVTIRFSYNYSTLMFISVQGQHL